MPACAPAQPLQSRAASRCLTLLAGARKTAARRQRCRFLQMRRRACRARQRSAARARAVRGVCASISRGVLLLRFSYICCHFSVVVHSFSLLCCCWSLPLASMWAVIIEVFECRRSPWIARISRRSARRSSISSTAGDAHALLVSFTNRGSVQFFSFAD
jgi:hypothetical protein